MYALAVLAVLVPSALTAAGQARAAGKPPSVSGFFPASGPRGGSVSIFGGGFTGATSVKLGSVAAVFSVTDDSTISATVPATATTGKLTVTAPGGSRTSTAAFTVQLPPAVSGFTPSSGPVGTEVTIDGTSVGFATSATIGDAELGGLVPVNPNRLRATVPAGAVAGRLRVTSALGTSPPSAGTFRVLPRVAALDPRAALRGELFGILGSELTGATSVQVNGVAANFVAIEDTQILAWVPAKATTGKVTVTTPLGTGTSTGPLVVVQPPRITSFSPAAGGPGTEIAIRGEHLDEVTSVTLGGTPLYGIAYVSSTRLRATVPVGAPSGKLRVENPAGVSPPSAGTFKVLPRITELDPVAAVRGAEITIDGYGLAAATSVKVRGVPASFTVEDGRIRATVPAATKTGKVTVTTPAGTAESVKPLVVYTTPKITSIDGPYTGSGTEVLIRGTDFYYVGEVTLNGSPVRIARRSATQLAVRLYASDRISTGRFRVTTPAGTSLPSALYTVPPRLDRIDPDFVWIGDEVRLRGTALGGATGVDLGGVPQPFTVEDDWTIRTTIPAAVGNGVFTVHLPGGRTVEICCFHFRLPPDWVPRFRTSTQIYAAPVGATVWLDGDQRRDYSGVGVGVNGVRSGPVTLEKDGYRIAFTVPEGATTGPIRFYNAAGDGPAGTAILKVSPRIDSFTPASGPPGTVVAITGTSFTGATRVQFGKSAAAAFTLVDDTTIRAVVPPGAGTGRILVATCTGEHSDLESYGTSAKFVVTGPGLHASSRAAGAGDPGCPPPAAGDPLAAPALH